MKIEAAPVELTPRDAAIRKSKDFLTCKVQQNVKSIIKKEGYISYDVEVKFFTPEGGSYLGILCETNIKGETVTGHKETNLFIKMIIPNDKMTVLSLPEVYRRELFYYTNLSKVLAEVQDEVNVPSEDRFKTVRCFEESNEEALIFYNMSKKGYKTLDRTDVMSIEYAELAMKQLAKFHALSYVLEKKQPSYFAKNIQTIKQPFSFGEDYKQFMLNASNNALKYLDSEKRSRLEKFIPTMFERYTRCLTNNEGTKCCLVHGDYRPNNILMVKNNGAPTDLVPIDYQLIHYGCPVLDFLYFIMISTDQHFRRTYIPYLKTLYHDTMRTYLTHFNLSIDDIYPKEEFERVYNERLDYGLIIALMLIPLLLTTQEDVPDLTQSLSEIKLESYSQELKDRIGDIVQDYIDWGCI